MDVVQGYAYTDPASAIVLGGFVLLGIAMLGLTTRNIIRSMGKYQMKRKAKERAEIRSAIADLVTDLFEEAIMTGLLTKDDVYSWYYKISHLGAWDCMPRRLCVPPPNPDILKEAIKARMKGKLPAKYINGGQSADDLEAELSKLMS